jgi:alkanesulfonate monooxygenase SsuD/methylene tetrahydromethanopterin reductase-like flavin-dependent oxidoreductase (luciferase family)
MVGANVFAADTEEEAQLLFSSLQQQFVNLRRGRPGPLQPPLENTTKQWSEEEQEGADHALACSFVGTPEVVKAGLENFLAKTSADEIVITAQIYDHTARMRSFELAAGILSQLDTPVYEPQMA